VKPIDISVLHNAEPELLEIAAAAAAMLDAHDADVVNPDLYHLKCSETRTALRAALAKVRP